MWRLYIFSNIFSHCTKNCRNFAARMKESMKKNCTQCLSAHETAPWGLSITPPRAQVVENKSVRLFKNKDVSRQSVTVGFSAFPCAGT